MTTRTNEDLWNLTQVIVFSKLVLILEQSTNGDNGTPGRLAPNLVERELTDEIEPVPTQPH